MRPIKAVSGFFVGTGWSAREAVFSQAALEERIKDGDSRRLLV